MSKVQRCQYACDREGCKSLSREAPNFTDARKLAEADGWFIRPSDKTPEHVCGACIDKTLAGLNPADKAPGHSSV